MVNVIQIFMLLAGSLIIIFTKTDTSKIGKNEIFKSGYDSTCCCFWYFVDGGDYVCCAYADDEGVFWAV